MAQRDPKRRRTALGTALASIHDALVGSREAEQNAVRVAEAMELLGLDDAPPSPAAAAVAAAAAAVDAVDDAGAAATAFADALVTSNAARGMEVGHAAVRRVRWALSNLGIKFTDQQTTFHDMMLYATLPHLFGAEWDANEAEILAYYGRARHSPRVAMSMPRSGGKTMAVTAFLASFMWAMVDSGLSIVCFSIQQDQARWVLESTLTLLSRLPGGEAMCHRKGVDLFVSHKSRDMASTTAIKLRAQSGNAAGGRGLQPDILLLEEAAFIDPELYFQTIFPMFAHARRSVIAISSPSDAGGVFSSLFSLRFESGDLIFDTVKDQNICDDCLLAKRMRCDHKIAVLPPWKTERQKELLRLMYANYPERFAKEVEGAMGATDAPVFAPMLVDSVFATSIRPAQAVPFLFVSIDPAAGGAGSDTAWTTLFFDHRDKAVITGCGARNMQGTVWTRDETHVMFQVRLRAGALIATEVDAIMTHITAVRALPNMGSAIVVLIAEANLDAVRSTTVSFAIKDRIDRMERDTAGHGIAPERAFIYSYDSKDRERPGIWLDANMKDKYVNTMLQFMQCNAIGVCDPFTGTEEDVIELRRQLAAFKRILEAPKTPFAKPRYTYSGKASGKDDRIISLLMALYHGTLFFQRPRTCARFGLWPRVIDGTGIRRLLRVTSTTGAGDVRQCPVGPIVS